MLLLTAKAWTTNINIMILSILIIPSNYVSKGLQLFHYSSDMNVNTQIKVESSFNQIVIVSFKIQFAV